MTLTSSTVSANSAAYSGGIESSGVLTLTNSTISGNSAEEGASELFNIGTAGLGSSTVSGELAGGPGVRNLGTLTVSRSLIAGVCAADEAITSNGYNLESPGNTCGLNGPGDQAEVTGEALGLGPLGDNGGPTATHALRDGSVAIDVIPVELCGVASDQRGEPRPETPGSACDVGAFELQPAGGGS